MLRARAAARARRLLLVTVCCRVDTRLPAGRDAA
jgi:hypothetical protein